MDIYSIVLLISGGLNFFLFTGLVIIFFYSILVDSLHARLSNRYCINRSSLEIARLYTRLGKSVRTHLKVFNLSTWETNLVLLITVKCALFGVKQSFTQFLKMGSLVFGGCSNISYVKPH